MQSSQDELKKLGQNIKRLRKARGMNQTSLANEAQTRPTTISSIENGSNLNPGWELLGRVAKVLNVSIHDLTQPEVIIDGTEKRKTLAPGIAELMHRQDELLSLGERRISLSELEWLTSMPVENPDEMTAEKYLIILRHYRLIAKETI